MNNHFNLIDIIRILLKWKWHIAATTIVSGIAAVIVSLYILKPYYQSYALVYPTNQSMSDRTALFGHEGSSDNETYYYGTKHDANRILTIANASWLVQYVIETYQLAAHYGYGEGTKYLNTKVTEEFLENYAVYKTDKDAIRINLIDTDPALAAEIVNDIVETIDYEITKPIKVNKEKLRDLFIEKEAEKKKQVELLKNELLNLSKKTEAYELAKIEFENVLAEYHEISLLAEQYQTAANQHVPGIEIIEHAYPAERKMKPVRSRICVVTVVITFFFACLGALLVEQGKWIKEQLDREDS